MKPRSIVLTTALAIPLALGAAAVQKERHKTMPVRAASPAPKRAPGAAAKPAMLEQNRDQAATAALLYDALSRSKLAYRPHPLDEALSKAAYDKLLETFDPNRMFLTADDVAKFGAQRAGFDDAIRGGSMDVPFALFDLYRQRVHQRTDYARSLLRQDVFTFTGTDRYEYDREEAPWASAEQLDALWRQSVRYDWLRLKLAGKTPEDIRTTLDKRYRNTAKAVDELESEDVFQTMMNAYTNAVDPHTDYFNPRAAERFRQQMSLQLQGIGAQLQKQDDVVLVRELIPGGPAQLSGLLRAGDRIVSVGQGTGGAMEDVVGWRIDDVVEKIKGPKGTKVRLGLIAPQAPLDGKPRIVQITRDIVNLVESRAKSQLIEVPAADGHPAQRVGVIKLPGFYEDFEARGKGASASRDVAALLEQFKQRKVDGVVLDLRNNGGGSLDEAVSLTGLFIDTGPVVQERRANGSVGVRGDRTAGVSWNGPVAVLVNRGSASASEILAGAIKDYGRGLIVGETTFGKGTVQELLSLDRAAGNAGERFGQLKVTREQFFLPDGASTQLHGVSPDVAMPSSVDASDFGESKYKNALPWSSIAPLPHVRYGQFAGVVPQVSMRHEGRIARDVEFGWLKEDQAEFRRRKAEKSIVLNEAERRAERQKDEARVKFRQAERRRLGLPLDPLAEDWADDGLSYSERDVVKDAERQKQAEDRPDPILRETAAVLADTVEVMAKDAAAAKAALPVTGDARQWAR